MGKVKIAKIAVFTLAALVISGLGTVGFPGLSAPVSAQVNEENFEIFRERSDLFEVAVAITPRTPVVGGVHFSVEALDATTQNTVTDARVLIVAHDEDDVPIIQTLALNTPLAPDSYEGNLTFELPARWTLRIEVDSPSLGAATFRVPLTVKSGTPLENPMGGIVFLGVIAALVGGTIYVWHSSRKARRRRAAV